MSNITATPRKPWINHAPKPIIRRDKIEPYMLAEEDGGNNFYQNIYDSIDALQQSPEKLNCLELLENLNDKYLRQQTIRKDNIIESFAHCAIVLFDNLRDQEVASITDFIEKAIGVAPDVFNNICEKVRLGNEHEKNLTTPPKNHRML